MIDWISLCPLPLSEATSFGVLNATLAPSNTVPAAGGLAKTGERRDLLRIFLNEQKEVNVVEMATHSTNEKRLDSFDLKFIDVTNFNADVRVAKIGSLQTAIKLC